VGVDANVLTLGVDYTVTGVGNSGGGMVELLSAPANLSIVWRLRLQPVQQQTDYLPNEAFPHTQIEQDFDALVKIAQELKEVIGRAITFKPSSSLVNQTVDDPTTGLFARAKVGGGIDWATPVNAGGPSLPISIANGGTGAITAALARTALGALAVTGGVASGLTAVADPAVALGMATKQYVDAGDASAAAYGVVTSYTGNATLGATTRLAVLSGASFTLTLPPVAGMNKRIFTVLHQGTSLTQIYTIKANAAESLVAPDGTANTYLLYTAGEQASWICDNAQWILMDHEAITDWVDAGAMLIAATGGNPTKPAAPDLDHVYWRREGNQVYLKYILQISSAAGSAAGTGNYLFALPTNIVFDIAVLTPVAVAIGAATRSEAVRSSLNGTGFVQVDSVSATKVQCFAFSTTAFQVWRCSGLDAPVSSTSAALTTAEMSYYFELNARAANWRL
jgi:hypothetical protein